MQEERHFYLINLQYLGFRYHGWAKQPNVKTVQGMVDRTLRYVLGSEVSFKTLGSGRTDAMVSAEGAVLELFLRQSVDKDQLLVDLNNNLPQDIRATSIVEVDEHFNIIQSSKEKEYIYLFSFGKKYHPFAAPYMTNIQHQLDIDLMMEGAASYVGYHNFKAYSYKPTGGEIFEREVLLAEIKENTEITASFFPKVSYVFKVKGEGFMRYQIRLMMGALILLGKGEISLSQLRESLKGSSDFEQYVAPASGLILNNISFEKDL